MTKQILMACGFGLLLGVFFLTGRWTASQVVEVETVSQVVKEKTLKKIQEELKYTYYSELLKKPSEEPVGAAAEPEPVAPPPPVTPVVTQSAEPDKMAKALAKVLGNETPESVKSVIKESLPSGTGLPYAIQVASLPNRLAAEEFVKRLLKKGYAAKLVQADIPGKGSMYRVRIHGFKTREEADRYREEKQIEGITVDSEK